MAVDKMFNVTHWPYVQVSTAYNCVSMFFADSYYNLIRKNAHMLAIAALGITTTVGALYF